jgi:ankyrin repeat protein
VPSWIVEEVEPVLLTHREAQRLVEQFDLIGPCHGSVPGDYDRVRELLDTEPRLVPALNALDPAQMEETPQGAAAHLFCREILLYMLSLGVQLDLFMACALGEDEKVGAFLQNAPALANACGAHGIHVLNHAATTSVAHLLLERGADPHRVVYQPWGWTPLHEAAYRGRAELLRVLAAAGGNLDAGPEGMTPLHAAARMGHQTVVQWLVSQGASTNARVPVGPWRGMTAFMIAEENGHDEIALFLRRHGAAV